MRFSLIIPCYNEADTIPLLLERCKEVIRYPDVEIILVDNGSIDNSPKVLLNLLPKYPGCRSVRVEKNKGYGFGIISGLQAAKGEILGWTHADMQTDPQDVLHGLKLFDKYGPNVFVKGCRYGRPFTDTIFTIGMSVFESVLLGKRMWDINAQPTLFPRSFFEAWQDAPHDFSLDLYAYFQARNSKIPVYRYPVLFGKRVHGISRWNVNWNEKRKFIMRTFDFSFQLKSRIKKGMK